MKITSSLLKWITTHTFWLSFVSKQKFLILWFPALPPFIKIMSFVWLISLRLIFLRKIRENTLQCLNPYKRRRSSRDASLKSSVVKRRTLTQTIVTKFCLQGSLIASEILKSAQTRDLSGKKLTKFSKIMNWRTIWSEPCLRFGDPEWTNERNMVSICGNLYSEFTFGHPMMIDCWNIFANFFHFSPIKLPFSKTTGLLNLPSEF